MDFSGHTPLRIFPFFLCTNRRIRAVAGELKLFLEVKYFTLTRVCHKICSKNYVANSDKKIVMWLPAFLNSSSVSERGKKWMFLFFTVSVSLLARSVLLISFPAYMGCQALSAPIYCPPLCALLLDISTLSLQLSSHLVGVWSLPTQRKKRCSQ